MISETIQKSSYILYFQKLSSTGSFTKKV